jgi:hypothetical protein
MELYKFRLCAYQARFHHTWFFPRDNCRHGLISDHTYWLVRPTPSRWRHVWFDPPSLETGEAVILTSRGSSDPLLLFYFIGGNLALIGLRRRASGNSKFV